MHHSDADNEEAAKEAVRLLSAKELADGQPYLWPLPKQLQQQSKALPSLNAPMLGDALVKSDMIRPFGWLRLSPRPPSWM